MPDFHIHPELQFLLDALTPEEMERLRTNLANRPGNIRIRVAVVQGERWLMDGHNRYEICEAEGIPYEVDEEHFVDLDAVKAAMIAEQMGRRNVSPERKAYYRGKEYLAAKGPKGGANPHGEGSAAKKVGKKAKVSKATVERDAAFAQGVDKLSAEAKKKVLAGKEPTQTKGQIATGLFCDRCLRAGPTKNCKSCAALREEAGRKKKAAKKSASGQITFNWKPWEAEFGAIFRQVDKLAAAFKDKAKANDQGDALRGRLSAFRAEFRNWYRELSGLKPPTE